MHKKQEKIQEQIQNIVNEKLKSAEIQEEQEQPLSGNNIFRVEKVYSNKDKMSELNSKHELGSTYKGQFPDFSNLTKRERAERDPLLDDAGEIQGLKS